MGYDRDDSFPFNFEPNLNPFGSKSKGKLSPRSFPFNVKANGNIVFSVCVTPRDCSAFRHHGSPIVDISLNPPVHHSSIVLRGLRGALNCSPIMTREARFWDSKCEFFFQSGPPADWPIALR